MYLTFWGMLVFACEQKASTESTQVVDNEKDKVAQPVANNTPAEAPKQAAGNTSPVKKEDLPVFKFEKTEYDFGQIKEGQMVKYTFKFKNTGKTPLVIQNATASCGCTVPEWTKEPIAPNADGEIRVEFNSAGKGGPQTKTISINANTEPTLTELTIKGMVIGNTATNGPVRPK